MNDKSNTPGADALGDAWDRIVTGHHSSDSPLGDEVMRLHERATSVAASASFRNRLREDIMQTYRSSTAAGTVMPAGDRSIARIASRLPVMRTPRWVSLAATVLLLLATVSGGYLALTRTDRPSGRELGGGIVASPIATPDTNVEARPQDPCEGVPPYVACRQNTIVGDGPVSAESVSETLLEGTNISLFRWSIQRSQQDDSSFDTDDHNGVAIDFVERGAYRATFSESVTVYRGDVASIGDFTTFYQLLPGQAVELSRGDSVVYPLGSRTLLENVFTYVDTPLYGATIVVSELPDVDVPIKSSVIQLGTATLEQPLIEYIRKPGESTALFRLMYVQVPLGSEIPSDGRGQFLVMGPIYANPGAPESAYMLWLRFPKG